MDVNGRFLVVLKASIKFCSTNFLKMFPEVHWERKPAKIATSKDNVIIAISTHIPKCEQFDLIRVFPV